MTATALKSLDPASRLALGAGLACALLIQPAAAQTIGYEGVDDSASTFVSGGSGDQDVASSSSQDKRGRGKGKSGGKSGGKRIEIAPYIEVDQIVDAELSPGDEVLTYTQVAAGLDVGINGRHNAASASVRYERHIGWGKAADGNAVSGIGRGYATVLPGLTVEAGALATRTHVDGGASSLRGGSSNGGSLTNVYSVYGGPSLQTRAGPIDVSANYRAGLTKVDTDNASTSADTFDRSLTQVADAEAGVAPGTILPVGLAVAGSFYQEDISNLDQRVRDMQARGMVTVPVSRTVQATGAVGYEKVEVSSRDALRDGNGDPVIGSDGRYVTDKSAPRQIAYDTSGLIWEVGVMWRPSRRTALTAHVGRRYGATSFGGTFSYAPNDRSSLSIAVYDNIAGYGGQVSRALEELPDDFEAVRDPLTGELGTCVDTLKGNGCIGSALSSLRSSTFRARGVSASYTMKIGRINAGIGGGYDRRKYIAASGTVLASANGTIDENYWLSAYLSGALGESAGWSATAYANWLDTSGGTSGDVASYGASAAYYQMLTRRLRATAAVGIDGVSGGDDPVFDAFWSASALVGLRYGF